MEKVKVIAGRSNKPLAEGICQALQIKLTNSVIESFANGEIKVEINEDIRGHSVYIIQTGGNTLQGSINDYLVETLLLIDACKRADAAKVNVVLACFPYARSDKKDRPRIPISSSMITNVLIAAGCDRIITMDLHSGQIQGFTNHVPFDNLYGIKLHIENLQNTLFLNLTKEEINDKFVLVSMDVGGAKRIKEYAKRLSMSYAIMDKQRDYSKSNTVLKSVLVGNVKDKIAICIDDMADTCGTILAGIEDLKIHNCKGAIILVTHGILSGPAASRINDCDFISQVIVIDTLDQTENLKLISKLSVIDSSPLFAEVIKRITLGGSLSAMFN
jgi:ribose-phosphate pyrophosphokinase